MGSNDGFTMSEDQMETEEDFKLFLPQSPMTQDVDYEPSDDESSSSTSSEDEADGKNSNKGGILTSRMTTYRSIAIFMKKYYNKHPSSSRIQIARAYRKETKTPLTENTIISYSKSLISLYRQLRCEFDKLKSCANRKKLISERCPYYDDIHEALQHSDYYRNYNWTPTCKCGRPPQKTSELQPTTSNASRDDEMENTEATDYPRSPETAKRSISEGKNSTSRDRHLERSVIGREAVIRIPPLKMQGCDQEQADGEEEVVEIPPLQLQDCDHKQESSKEPVEPAKATVKTQFAIDKSKLSREHQLELMKLEDRKEERMDRKEERQFQMQLTKQQQENEIMKLKLQQEYEITKLKLQIEYERVKNGKQ